MSEMRIVPDDMSFHVFEISKQRLKGLYKINTMEFKAVDNMDESDMVINKRCVYERENSKSSTFLESSIPWKKRSAKTYSKNMSCSNGTCTV